LDGWGLAIAKEEVWDIRVVVVDLAVRGKCIKQFVLSVKKSARSRLNQEKIVRFSAGIVIQNVRTKAVKGRREERGAV